MKRRGAQLSRQLAQAASALLARRRLRACHSVGAGPRVTGPLLIAGDGQVILGDRVMLDSRVCAIELRAGPGAEIRIDDDVVIGPGTSIEAHASVHIGARAQIGRFCKILDTQFHSLRGDRHKRPPPTPVEIGADAELGPMCVLLPGAQVDAGASVGPGQVVSRRIVAPRDREG